MEVSWRCRNGNENEYINNVHVPVILAWEYQIEIKYSMKIEKDKIMDY